MLIAVRIEQLETLCEVDDKRCFDDESNEESAPLVAAIVYLLDDDKRSR